MRVYLDTSIFQDLKRDENSSLLSLVNNDKNRSVYVFSEAHLHDLNRDTSIENFKFNDMDFIEGIAGSNCFWYEEKVKFKSIAPRVFYDNFDWPLNIDFSDIPDLYKSILPNIPLNLGVEITEENLPADCPPIYRELFKSTSNTHDLMDGLLKFAESISTEQSGFKDVLKYLHANSESLNQSFNIEGFDGVKVTDIDLFRNSFLDLITKNAHSKDEYNVFIEAYNALELYGIVKGKPRKQKVPNLRDDARHAFFGACCDIVVSKDVDFINKTKFIYQLYDIETRVMSGNEFETYLNGYDLISETLEGIFSENGKNANDFDWQRLQSAKGFNAYQRKLNTIYYGLFDSYAIVFSKKTQYWYLTKESLNSFYPNILKKELELVVNRLVSQLGVDLHGNSVFKGDEVENHIWNGRFWLVGKTLISLEHRDGILFFMVTSMKSKNILLRLKEKIKEFFNSSKALFSKL